VALFYAVPSGLVSFQLLFLSFQRRQESGHPFFEAIALATCQCHPEGRKYTVMLESQIPLIGTKHLVAGGANQSLLFFEGIVNGTG